MAVLGIMVLSALADPVVSHAKQVPPQDSATGNGTAFFFGQFQIDARSGPSGESATGQVSVNGAVSFDGPVTCLAVLANVATLNIQTSQFGLVTMEVTDNAAGGADVIDAALTGRAPSDCSPFAGGAVGNVLTGDIVVVDSAVRQPPKVNKLEKLNKLNQEVSGPFNGTTFFEARTHGCSFVFQVFDLTYTAVTGGTGTLHLEGCVEVTSDFQYNAAFVFTTPAGATLRGTTTGGVSPFDLVLNVAATEGKRFRRVGGNIHLTGTWSVGSPNPFPGTASGTLEGALVRGK